MVGTQAGLGRRKGRTLAPDAVGAGDQSQVADARRRIVALFVPGALDDSEVKELGGRGALAGIGVVGDGDFDFTGAAGLRLLAGLVAQDAALGVDL